MPLYELEPCAKTIPDDESLEKMHIKDLVNLVCAGRSCGRCVLNANKYACCTDFRDNHSDECRPFSIGYLKFLRDEFQK